MIQSTKQRRNSLYARSLRSFLALLLIPLVLFLIVSGGICAKLESDSLKRVQASLDSMARIVKIRMEGVTSLCAQISQSQELKNLGADPTPMNRWIFSRYLQNSTMDNNFIQGIAVYRAEENRIYTAHASYSEEEFFRYVLSSDETVQVRLRQTLHAGGFQEFIGTQRLSFEELPYSGMIYAMAYPAERESAAFQGRILALIPSETFDSLCEDINLYGGGIWMLTQEDEVIYRSVWNGEDVTGERLRAAEGDKVRLYGKKYHILSAEETGVPTLYAAVSDGILVDRGLLLGMSLLMLLTNLLSILLAVLVTRRQTRPIEKIAHIIEGGGSGDSTIDYQEVAANIKRLLKDYDRVASREQEQQEVLKYAFFEKLLNEELDEELIQTHSVALEWLANFDQFGILMIRLKSLGQQEIPERLFQAVLVGAQEEEPVCYAYETDENTILFLLGFSDRADGDCRRRTRQISDTITGWIQSESMIQTSAAACGFSGRLFEVARMARKATQLLREKAERPGRTEFWADKDAADRVIYDLEEERKLFNMTVSGNDRDVRQMLNQLREGELEHLDQLCKALTGTLYRIIAARELPAVWEERVAALTESGAEELFDQIEELFLNICQSVGGGQKRKQEETIGKITEYIHQNYQNSDLSLGLIAERFGLTIKHLSYVYKKYTGSNLSGDIEALRIGRACELLRETVRPIAEICEESGFWSETTFRRAFKKRMDESPAEYRQRYQA